MTDQETIEGALTKISDELTWERLYRIELQRAIPAPAACAPEPSSPTAQRFAANARAPDESQSKDERRWETVALFYDLHDRTLPQILEEISELLEGEVGTFRVQIYYWDGRMETPTPGRLMGRGENFLYSSNPRGDTVQRMEPPTEFELGDKE